MKEIFILVIFVLSICLPNLKGQPIKDPLLHYFQQIQSYAKPNDRIYVFQAEFTDSKKESMFITDLQSKLGPHGDYAWSIYCPQASLGFMAVKGGVIAKKKGPDYIGYISQLKKYGAITGGKDTVLAQYLDSGSIKMQSIDRQREHSDSEHYPIYFKGKISNYDITTYTLDQLKQKYASPDTTNVIDSSAK